MTSSNPGATLRTTSKTERKAADRDFMARAVVALAKQMNLHYERDDDPHQRVILVSLAAKSGLRVTVELDGKSKQPDVHVLGWNMHHTSERKLNNATFGGDVNPHHCRKATYIAYGFEELMAMLEKGFKMANDGTAYQP